MQLNTGKIVIAVLLTIFLMDAIASVIFAANSFGGVCHDFFYIGGADPGSKCNFLFYYRTALLANPFLNPVLFIDDLYRIFDPTPFLGINNQ